jgi:excisionase family DNA binding protein
MSRLTEKLPGAAMETGAAIPILMSIDEVAASLRVSSKTVRRLIDSRDLRAVRISRRVLVRRAEVERFVLMQENLGALAS